MTDYPEVDSKSDDSNGFNSPLFPFDLNIDDASVLLAEADALAIYIARQGDIIAVGNKAQNQDYETLLNALAAAKEEETNDNWIALITAYSKVTAITFTARGVNGRTILDTIEKHRETGWRRFTSTRNRPVFIGCLLFVTALVLQVLAEWQGRVSDPTELNGIQAFTYDVMDALATFLIPAAWGGLGACIFLMKRLSDKLFNMSYEKARLKGDVTRVFLGAMLGTVVVLLFFPQFGEKVQLGDVSFGPSAAAFLAGLGVKPVYAAFEALSEEFSARLQQFRHKGKGGGG